MISTLKNKYITIKVKNLGAELISLSKNHENYEYIWSGDSQFWSGQSPVLFPIIGNLVNGKTKINGEEFIIGNHGFARKTEFELIKQTNNQLIYSLKYNEATMNMYPYKFELQLAYTIEKSNLKISYTIFNLDEKTIYFQLGTHPGFNIPMDKTEEFSNYYLEFEKTENLKRYFFDSKNLLIDDKLETFLNNSNKLSLNHEMFYEGAFIAKNIKSKKLILKSDKGIKSITIQTENFPYLGLWQPKNAPFVCIEPWHGIAESKNFTKEFKEKEAIISLMKNQIHKASLNITI